MPETPLDAAADRLARRLLAAHPATRAYGRADLDALPPAVARVLAVGLDHTAASLAREVRPETPWLDAGAPALTAAVAAWAEAVHAAVQYPAEAWAEAVGAASQVALRLLVHPADGLAAVAFDGDEAERPAADVLARVRAASPYGYLPEVATRYAERKGVETLDRPALERLLARIDRRMTDALGPDEWQALAEPLFETAGPEGMLPIALVRAFFEARGHGEHVAALTADEVSRDALRDALVAAMPANGPTREPSVSLEPEPVVAQDPPAHAAPVFASTEEDAPWDAEPPAAEISAAEARSADEAPVDPDPVSNVAAPGFDEALPLEPTAPASSVAPASLPLATPASDSGVTPSGPLAVVPPPVESSGTDEPLWQRLARQSGGPVLPAVGRPSTDEPPPLWQRFAADAPLADVPPPPAVAAPARDVPPVAVDLRSVEARVLGNDAGERRDWYVAELFDGDRAAYEATLARLDAAGTWTVATQIIAEDVFRRYRVHIYDDAAVTFTDAVEASLARRGPVRP